MKSRDYWRDRFLDEKARELDYATNYEVAMRGRLKYFERALDFEIERWYKKYAENENIDLASAKKYLEGISTKNWNYTLKEFEAKAKAGGYEKELNSEYYKSRIARLQKLNQQLKEIAAKYAEGESDKMLDALMTQYENTYLHETYLKQSAYGQIDVDFSHFSEEQLRYIATRPWDGNNFSERVWHNYAEVLPDQLTDALLRGTLLGYSYDKVSRMMRGRFTGVANHQIHRLVTTEMAHVAEVATAKFYEDSDIGKYQYMATLEAHTCEVCARLDERIFKVEDRVEGVNYPVMHPYCRCTTVPYMDGLPNIPERWERNPETGKGEYVKNMPFDEWKKIVTDKKMEKQYDSLIKEYGRHSFPKTLQEFKDAMYNNGIENRALKAYVNAREKGTVEPVVTYYDYVNVMKRLEDEVIGTETLDNRIVRSYSNHIIDRIFGVSVDPQGHKRIGVSIDEIKEMLQSSEMSKRKDTTKFVTDKGHVVISDKGNLITVVPRRRTKNERIKI